MIKVDVLPINPWQENIYILSDETKECVIIDPGCLSRGEKQYVVDFITQNKFKPVRLLQTHLHLDHIFGARFISEHFGLKLTAHKEDEFLIGEFKSHAAKYGIPVEDETPELKEYVSEGDVIEFGNSILNVMHLPGHSPGGVAYYNEDDKLAIVGDSIFRESIGRTDLPRGDYNSLISCLKNKLLALDEAVVLYPGHGPSTTVGHEKKNNSFLI